MCHGDYPSFVKFSDSPKVRVNFLGSSNYNCAFSDVCFLFLSR